MNESSQQKDELETYRQFIMWQYWLPLSGMPEAVNAGTKGGSNWLLATFIILQDHHTEGLKRDRCGEGLASFRWRRKELARAAGVNETLVKRTLARIAAGKWLDYVAGHGQQKSVFTVNRDVIRKLYDYHAVRAPSSVGGLQDLPNEDERTARPRVVYGSGNGPVQPVLLETMDVVKLWRRRKKQSEFAKVNEVQAILGLLDEGS